MPDISITSGSFKLAAYADGNPGSSHLALVMPGYLDTKDHPHMRSHVDYLATRGFFAISFDPPGTWGSEGDISQYTMTNWLQAIKDVIKLYDKRPTFVMGHSRGGSMAMLVAINCPQVKAFAAVMSKASYGPGTPTNHPLEAWKQTGYRDYEIRVPRQPGQTRHFRVPYSVMADTMQYDMTEGLSKLSIPKLFIAGAKDTAVPASWVKSAYDAAAGPKQLVQINYDHLYRRYPEAISEVNDTVGQFLSATAGRTGFGIMTP